MSGKRILFVSFGDENDYRHAAGQSYYLVRMLRNAGVDLDYRRIKTKWIKAILFPVKWVHRLFGREYFIERNPFFLLMVRLMLARGLGRLDPALVFTDTSILAAAFPGSLPVFYWTDAVIEGFAGSYLAGLGRPRLANLAAAHRQEQQALDRCAGAFYASRWAIDDVLAHYRVDRAKLCLVPFAPNLAAVPSEAACRGIVAGRPRAVLRLLFVGRDWVRKGGAFAVAVARLLTLSGQETVLTVVGCRPFEREACPSFVEQEGDLDTSGGAGWTRYRELLESAHFYLLPTRAEAMGIAPLEANAFGVPALASAVGGVPTVVRHGGNGFLFPPDGGPESWSEAIVSVWRDREAYAALCLSARRLFDDEYCWSRRTGQIIDLIGPARRPA